MIDLLYLTLISADEFPRMENNNEVVFVFDLERNTVTKILRRYSPFFGERKRDIRALGG
jgi:hypothetical protein